ncbi:hypothetical protein [Flavihumibacter profundi]|uniref:hypothetical protein n=1 Tax=Flavihumibacter profundi TaxID=2716883 RepID=UPI001CC78309|nr:hypothetical protein [Flavihumibacter profundi]MBZ5856619.1 hypothetical protein [Flavihumibacter profundi]
MNRFLLFTVILAISFFSCKKYNTSPVQLEDGIYSGTFQRLVNGYGQVSKVTLTFSRGIWTGESEFAKYPALCHGTYSLDQNGVISFVNDCVFTAEFDWSLILSHQFSLNREGDSISFSRSPMVNYTDIYRLKKQ